MQQIRLKQQDKLAILAQLCKERDVNPSKGNYAGFIQNIACGKMLLSPRAAAELTKTLTSAYYSDRWQSLTVDEAEAEPELCSLKVNQWQPAIPESRLAVIKQELSAKTPTLDALKNLQSQPSIEIKTIPPQPAKQSDRLTEKQIAQTLYAQAQRDTFDGIGRIILAEARDIADNKRLQVEELVQLWQKYYPLIDAESRSNVLLVFWDGKDTHRKTRDAVTPIIPKIAPVFRAKDNPMGDVEDDTYDEQAAEAVD